MIRPMASNSVDPLLLALTQQQSQQNPGRTYRPMEAHAAQDLVSALQAGLAPDLGAQILAQIQGGAEQRWASQQANRRALTSTASDALLQLAQTNPNPEAAAAYMGGFQTLHPNMAPQAEDRLAAFSQQIYPGGETSPLYQGEQAQTVTPEELAGVWADATTFAAGSLDQPAIPLEDARKLIVGQFRAQGYPEAEITKVWEAVGMAYAATGAETGTTPITTEDRLQQQAARGLLGQATERVYGAAGAQAPGPVQAPGPTPAAPSPGSPTIPVDESFLRSILRAPFTLGMYG